MMRTYLAALAFAGLLGACGGEPPAPPAAELGSGISLENMDTTIAPGDDFFSYVNGRWLAETEIPADKSSHGGFGILRDQAQEHVREIIEAAAAGGFPEGSDEQKIGDLYAAYMDLETRNALGVTPLQAEFARIDALANHADLGPYFAEANRRGYEVPVSVGQVADFKDPTRYMIYGWQAGLGMPEREYYLKDDARSQELRAAYRNHIAAMFTLAGLQEGEAAADRILALETRLAEAHITKEAARDWPTNYNKVPVENLAGVMPNFNWDGYLEAGDLGELDALVLMMTSYFEALDDLLVVTPLEDWKTYLRWVVLNTRASALTEELDAQNFAFYGKTLRGTEAQRPLWRRAVGTVDQVLGEVVGKAYVRQHFPPEAKARMETLVANLLKAYEVSIRELEWMSEATKTEALKKLSKFTTKIGYPDQWRDYAQLRMAPDDLFGNLERAAMAEYDRQLARQGGPVDRTEWGMNPQTVNAYYMPPLNEIVFPAAILQPPFFDMNADDAVNYGAIGAVIGHEIGHGFDDKGSTFDGDGVMRNWWTVDDRAEFEARTGQLVAQYNSYKPFDDLSVNGEFTLGENIGDLGGITIGLLAYELALDGATPPVIDGFTGLQRVFLGYGQIWRNKYRPEALRERIMTDPHSPSKYRANGAVRNVPAFYEAFEVTPEQALYLPPEARVKIW
jgi:putative endopeptidase